MMCKIAAGLTASLALSVACHARVVRVTVERQESPAYAPPYERVAGRLFGELDPGSPLNVIINDIALAPRRRGRVEYSSTFTLLRPKEAAKASGVLWYEVPNRGNSPLNPRPAADALAAGHILLSSDWQGDLAAQAALETIVVPIARNPDGSPITGPVLARLSDLPAHSTTASLTGRYRGLRYQVPASLDTTKALLTKQASDDGQIIPISSRDWEFLNCEKVPFPGEPDPSRICLKGGLDADMLYQLTYTAKDPFVLGIGLAATRDIGSFFRYAARDDDGLPNPVANILKYAIAFGTSQSGNFIKTFIHLGFNQDETGRIVWDGANPNIAARPNPINFRFANPGGAAGPV